MPEHPPRVVQPALAVGRQSRSVHDRARGEPSAWFATRMHRAVWFASCLAACTASDPDPSCDEATLHSDLMWIQSNIFDRRCTLPSCHLGSGANAGHLDLRAGYAHGQLVDAASTSASAWKRVVPGNAAQSYLLVAIGQLPGPLPLDGIMPPGGPELCPEKRDAIQRWIEAGAPP